MNIFTLKNEDNGTAEVKKAIVDFMESIEGDSAVSPRIIAQETGYSPKEIGPALMELEEDDVVMMLTTDADVEDKTMFILTSRIDDNPNISRLEIQLHERDDDVDEYVTTCGSFLGIHDKKNNEFAVAQFMGELGYVVQADHFTSVDEMLMFIHNAE